MKGNCGVWRKWFAAIMAISACSAACCAQYRILPGKANSDRCIPQTSARICPGTKGTAHCFALPSSKGLLFGLQPDAMPVGRLDGQPLILFSATFSGCGSGALTSSSLLVLRNGEFVNLLPKVELTNQSEYKFWNLPNISKLPVFATADFIWDFGAMRKSNYNEETHFAAHRYQINVFVLDPEAGRYLQKLSYQTTNKYPGLDEVDKIQVLDAERPVILAKLR